jgi:hypothetical protein
VAGTRSLWDYMTASEQLLCDAARRRGDRTAFQQHWRATLTRVATDDAYDQATRTWARSHFKAEARRRLFGEDPPMATKPLDLKGGEPTA